MNKRIIICSDGTWNTPDQKEKGQYNPTNVLKIARAIAPVSPDGTHQVVFYDWGVGADQRGFDRLAGGISGVGLDKNIQDGYRFLMDNYGEGDEIYFFGFSRGAYTVRSTIGFIRKCGLLNKHQGDMLEEAYRIYRNEVHPREEEMRKFREDHSREVGIKFLGVWDTVGALGIPIYGTRFLSKKMTEWLHKRFEFHDTELSGVVKNAYQALAIDEKREPFAPTLWKNVPKEGQVVEQAWFPGVHGDIGGGYIEKGLGDMSFMWMKEKAENCGLIFNEDYIKKTMDPNPMDVLHDSFVGFLKLLGEHVRPIGDKENANERAHPSAIYRYENYEPPYRPKNLSEYLDNPEHRIAETRNRPEV